MNSGNQKATSYAEVDVSELLVLTWALDFSKLMKCVCVFYIPASPSFPPTHTLIKAEHVQLILVRLITKIEKCIQKEILIAINLTIQR